MTVLCGTNAAHTSATKEIVFMDFSRFQICFAFSKLTLVLLIYIASFNVKLFCVEKHGWISFYILSSMDMSCGNVQMMDGQQNAMDCIQCAINKLQFRTVSSAGEWVSMHIVNIVMHLRTLGVALNHQEIAFRFLSLRETEKECDEWETLYSCLM
jgi:hypothetical protein